MRGMVGKRNVIPLDQDGDTRPQSSEVRAKQTTHM